MTRHVVAATRPVVAKTVLFAALLVPQKAAVTMNIIIVVETSLAVVRLGILSAVLMGSVAVTIIQCAALTTAVQVEPIAVEVSTQRQTLSGFQAGEGFRG